MAQQLAAAKIGAPRRVFADSDSWSSRPPPAIAPNSADDRDDDDEPRGRPGREPLQRVDDGQGGAEASDPEPGAERDARRRRRRRGQRPRRLAGGVEQQQQQRGRGGDHRARRKHARRRQRRLRRAAQRRRRRPRPRATAPPRATAAAPAPDTRRLGASATKPVARPAPTPEHSMTSSQRLRHAVRAAPRHFRNPVPAR